MPKVEEPKVNEKQNGSQIIIVKTEKPESDVERILKEREADGSLPYQQVEKKLEPEPESESEPELEDLNDLKKCIPENDNNQSVFDSEESCQLRLLKLAIIDLSYYKNNLKINSNSNEDESCFKRLLLMSIEENELVAKTYFDHLMNADWSPGLNHIQECLSNWDVDLNVLKINKELRMQLIEKKEQIKQHNSELVMNLIHHYVMKTNNGYSSEDLLTLAKFCVALSFDFDSRSMIHITQQLFSDCIDKALHPHDHNGIKSFCNDLYSTYSPGKLSLIISDLFLPLKNPSMKLLFTFSTCKVFNSLLGKTDNLGEVEYISSEYWFVQYLVDENYFRYKPHLLPTTIKLLDHVVAEFYLYKYKDKLSTMHRFFKNVLSYLPLDITTLKLTNIVDKWRFELLRLHINQCIEELDNEAEYIDTE